MSLLSQKRNFSNFKREINENAEDYDKGFSESFADQWHFQTYTANSYSRSDNLHDEYAKEIEKIKNATGVELTNPYRTAYGEFFAETAQGMWHMAVDNPFKKSEDRWSAPKQEKAREEARVAKFYDKVKKLQEEHPDLEIRDEVAIHEDIKKQALEAYKQANDGREHSWWGDFLGSAGGSMVDPINATLTLATGGMASAAKTTVLKSLGKTAVAEFIENAGIEALIQPSVYEYKKELELPYSKEEAVANVVSAGVGGAALGTAAKGLHLSYKKVLDGYKKAKAKGMSFDAKTDEAAKALEKQIEYNDWSEKNNPLGKGVDEKAMHDSNVIGEMKRLTRDNVVEIEQTEISDGYDRVFISKDGDPNEKLALLEPEDMEKIWVNRGGYNGRNGVKGSGFGLVKVIYKHGKDEIPVEKADVMELPRIVREYAPIIDGTHGGNRTWSVKNAKGHQIIYADRVFKEDGERHLVTIHVVSRDDHPLKGVLSEKKNGRETKTVHTKDTAQEAYYRSNEGDVSPETSAPKSRFQDGGRSMDTNIAAEELKVNSYDNLTLDDIRKDFEAQNLAPEEKAQATEVFEGLKKENDWDSEMLECIVEFGNK